jgi:hypothetical protein
LDAATGSHPLFDSLDRKFLELGGVFLLRYLHIVFLSSRIVSLRHPWKTKFRGKLIGYQCERTAHQFVECYKKPFVLSLSEHVRFFTISTAVSMIRHPHYEKIGLRDLCGQIHDNYKTQ